MSLFQDIFSNSNRFIKGLTKEDQQQLAEIERLENEIKQFQEDQKKQKKSEFRITNRDMIKFRFLAMVMTFLGYILYSSLNIIYLILAAYIVSIAIEAVVLLFERYRFSRSMAITVSYVLLIVFLLS